MKAIICLLIAAWALAGTAQAADFRIDGLNIETTDPITASEHKAYREALEAAVAACPAVATYADDIKLATVKNWRFAKRDNVLLRRFGWHHVLIVTLTTIEPPYHHNIFPSNGPFRLGYQFEFYLGGGKKPGVFLSPGVSPKLCGGKEMKRMESSNHAGIETFIPAPAMTVVDTAR